MAQLSSLPFRIFISLESNTSIHSQQVSTFPLLGPNIYCECGISVLLIMQPSKRMVFEMAFISIIFCWETSLIVNNSSLIPCRRHHGKGSQRIYNDALRGYDGITVDYERAVMAILVVNWMFAAVAMITKLITIMAASAMVAKAFGPRYAFITVLWLYLLFQVSNRSSPTQVLKIG